MTKRKRRCGWLDAVMVRQAIKIGGIDGIAITKLDVLDGIEALKVCTGYHYKGEKLDHFPLDREAQKNVKPVYETFKGWKETTCGARNWDELPTLANHYIRRIEELIDAPISLLSTSPERKDTILLKDPFGETE